VFRLVAKQRYFESVRAEVADDYREVREAWRRAEKQDPHNYARRPVADKIRQEQRRIRAIFDQRDFRPCEHCGEMREMRKGQLYCSARCRVAAHRARKREASALDVSLG